jgi:hypothetical protein
MQISWSLPASARALVLSLQHGLIVRLVMAYGSSLISAVYVSGFHIAAIGVDCVWTCETIADTSNYTLNMITLHWQTHAAAQMHNIYNASTQNLVIYWRQIYKY